MTNKICSCFGHSEIEINEGLRQKLREIVEDLIVKRGINIFYFGGFGDFDDLFWQIVTEYKQKYPYIKRVFCVIDVRYLRANKRPKFLSYENFEEFIYLDLKFDWWYQRIYYRNIEMINQSDIVVFYIRNTIRSGAYKAYQYALKVKKDIIMV